MTEVMPTIVLSETDPSDMLFHYLIDDLIMEECLSVIWQTRTDNITLDEIYNLEPLSKLINKVPKAPPVIQQMPAVQQQPLTVSCPVCFEPVAGARFAPHLEKCMNGGKRVERRKASHALLDDNKIPSKQKVEAVDMHPSSLIIRIKLQNGVPKGNKVRLGASVEEFEQGESVISWNNK